MSRRHTSVLLSLAAALLAGCVVIGPLSAAAPPCPGAPAVPTEDDDTTQVVEYVTRQAIYALMGTMLISPRLIPKRKPPPDRPQPLIVKPPPPPVPESVTPVDAPPQLQETPEPGSLVTGLVGGTLAAMAWWRHRRRKPPAPEPAT